MKHHATMFISGLAANCANLFGQMLVSPAERCELESRQNARKGPEIPWNCQTHTASTAELRELPVGLAASPPLSYVSASSELLIDVT